MDNKITDVTDFLEEIAPLSYQEKYDNAGLITGDPNWKVSGVLTCLDVTDEILQEAKSKGCNLIVSHHPIIFRALKKLNVNYYVDRVIIKAIKEDIAIYAIHTNLDNVLVNGVNETIANRLGLIDQKILLVKDHTEKGVGAGLLAQTVQPLVCQDLLKLVKDKLQAKSIRHTMDLGRPINKVAICGGSGSFLISESIRQEADVLISADFKYHDFFEANGQILLIDIGHFESEQFTVDLLFSLISKNFPNFATHCTKINTNPIQYY